MRALGTALMLMVMVGAGRAGAQVGDTGPPSTAPPAEPPVSPPGVTPPLPWPPLASAPDTAPNPVAQVLFAGVFGTAGVFVGGFAGYSIECAGGCRGDFGGLGGALVGAAIGATLGTAAGVMVGGSDRDHEGSFGATLFGTALGGAATAIAVDHVHSTAAGLALVFAGATLGGTVMFDLTRTRVARGSPAPGTRVALVPAVTGRSVGLSLVVRAP